jgi:hypothetical protein
MGAGNPSRDIALINTHLDHVSDAQRQLGAAMVLHRARYEANVRPGVPLLVTGDLNRCVCVRESEEKNFTTRCRHFSPSFFCARAAISFLMFSVLRWIWVWVRWFKKKKILYMRFRPPSRLCFSSASGSDSGAYAVLTGAQPAPAVPHEFARRFPLSSPESPREEKKEGQGRRLVMRDLREAAPRAFVGGQWATFTGFGHRKADEACIDFVFGPSDGG